VYVPRGNPECAQIGGKVRWFLSQMNLLGDTLRFAQICHGTRGSRIKEFGRPREPPKQLARQNAPGMNEPRGAMLQSRQTGSIITLRLGAATQLLYKGQSGCKPTGVVGAAGLEPATTCLEGRCSIHLSYAPAYHLFSF
jgi:hypothetical protein